MLKIGDRVTWTRWPEIIEMVVLEEKPFEETGTIVHESSDGDYFAVTADSDGTTICGLTADQLALLLESRADVDELFRRIDEMEVPREYDLDRQ